VTAASGIAHCEPRPAVNPARGRSAYCFCVYAHCPAVWPSRHVPHGETRASRLPAERCASPRYPV